MARERMEDIVRRGVPSTEMHSCHKIIGGLPLSGIAPFYGHPDFQH